MKKINNGQLNINDVNKKVTLYGFVASKRKIGKLTFVDLRDRWGITQLVFEGKIENFTKESVLKITGKVVERKDKNPNLKTGDIEIMVEKLTIFSKAQTLPFVIKDKLEAKEDTRLNYRFLDLRRPIMQKKIILRHKLNKAIRDFFHNEDFLEIETPFLSKSTPEGARDFLVSTRKTGHFFALPQSPQMYKQLLMSSGFEKYFQIVKVFRDEDSRKDRQPEFTQLDVEVSYAKEEDIKNLIEKMFEFVFKKLNKKIKIPFQRMNYETAIERFGTDKPDLRFNNELNESTKIFKNSSFNAFKNSESVKFLYFKETLNKKDVSELEEVAKKNGAKGLIWGTFINNDGPVFKFLEDEIKIIIKKNHFNKSGTILFIGDDYEITTKSLGAIRTFLSIKFNWAKNQEDKFLWIENWPLFEYDKKTKKYTTIHHPFTSPTEKTIKNFDVDKKNAKARSYDVVMNGFEIGGGSTRIFDKNVQEKMFSAIGLSKEEYQNQFGFFLEIFKYGLPPHSGIALGIDRILMLLTNSNSIREVIAFPKNPNGIAVMEKAPSIISKKQLNEYKIKKNK